MGKRIADDFVVMDVRQTYALLLGVPQSLCICLQAHADLSGERGVPNAGACACARVQNVRHTPPRIVRSCFAREAALPAEEHWLT